MRKGNNPTISFNHIALHAQRHSVEITEKISDIIQSGVFINGKENATLERNLSQLLGGYVATTASGNDALFLALLSLHLSHQDEVIFPVNAYPTAFPIGLSGAKMVPVDVDENGQLDSREVMKKINKNTKAIVLVHLYGLVGDLEVIRSLAKKHYIVFIEDCAQAFGTLYNGKFVGTLGDIACFSFYPSKNLGTLGDGGALWTRHKSYYEYVIRARSYGEKNKYNSFFLSGHSRLPEIQAGILNIYSRDIEADFEKRKRAAHQYKKRFEKEKLFSKVRVLASHPQSVPVQHLFVIEAKKRNRLRIYLGKKRIPTLIHYPRPIHLVPAFSPLAYKKGDFPVAEHLSRRMISLPFHPYLSETDIDYIVRAIKEFYA